MLILKDITKTYRVADERIVALDKVSFSFEHAEFVSVLGPSGCGKTTLLNIVGGLDRYDSGDLIIDGISTKGFVDGQWDSYRNNSVGFVFQSYNLIGHLTVFENVELSLSLCGESASERKAKVLSVLERVGLSTQAYKKPNQLSGGQMQRVAIARALVNNPSIILADEPTGALDIKTGEQIMDLLHEVSKTCLVIMVTHNGELAKRYSTRIINLEDGKVKSDQINDINEQGEPTKHTFKKEISHKKTSMSFFAALKSSFKNLMTKKGRTVLTAIAGSIGIISISLILALSNGLNYQLNNMQSAMLSGAPITISNGEAVDTSNLSAITDVFKDAANDFPDEDEIYPYETPITAHINKISKEYVDFVEKIDKGLITDIMYRYGINLNFLHKNYLDNIVRYDQGVRVLPKNNEFTSSLYDVLDGKLPTSKNEAALIIAKDNTLSKAVLRSLGFDILNLSSIKFSELVNVKSFRVVTNDVWYSPYTDASGNARFSARSSSQYTSLFNNEDYQEVKITCILRIKKGAQNGMLSDGVMITADLMDDILQAAYQSPVAEAQRNNDQIRVVSGQSFLSENEYRNELIGLGSIIEPTRISIYAKDFNAKRAITEELDKFNREQKEKEKKLFYLDYASIISGTVMQVLDTVTYVLIAFSGISLVVSSVMIGIITYISVIERTKEIGVLRSIGARKKDITRIFNAETSIIGFVAGVLGVVTALLLCIPINIFVRTKFNIVNLASPSVWQSVLLVVGSTILTVLAGYLPALGAAKRDPVKALRSE